MKQRLIVLLIMTISVCSAVWAGGTAEEISPEPVSGGFKRIEVGESELFWKIDGDNLSLRFSAPTTGWIAVGFNPSRFMKDANIIIGYVENGKAVVSDHFGDSSFTHKGDEELGGTDNILSASGSESGVRTTIEVVIPLESGDQYDQPLAAGDDVTLILAYGRNGSDDFKTKHAAKTSAIVSL